MVISTLIESVFLEENTQKILSWKHLQTELFSCGLHTFVANTDSLAKLYWVYCHKNNFVNT